VNIMERRSLDSPDERRVFDKVKIDIVKLGGIDFVRVTAEPGWRWSESVKPVAKTESCGNRHVGYVVSGRWKFAMDDRSEAEFGAGDALAVPPGHDAWVVGQERLVYLEFLGAGNVAKQVTLT